MIAWRAEFYAGRAAWTPPVFCNTPATSTMQYGSHLRTNMAHVRQTRLDSAGDTSPCRMNGVTLHSHFHYKETYACTWP